MFVTFVLVFCAFSNIHEWLLPFEQGRHAFIGVAFNERNDAFDFNVALSEHKRELAREDDATNGVETIPFRDLSLKEGEKITVKIAGSTVSGWCAVMRRTQAFTCNPLFFIFFGTAQGGVKKEKPKAAGGGGFLLPPPGTAPKAALLAPPPADRRLASGTTPVRQAPAPQSTSSAPPSSSSSGLLDVAPAAAQPTVFAFSDGGYGTTATATTNATSSAASLSGLDDDPFGSFGTMPAPQQSAPAAYSSQPVPQNKAAEINLLDL